MEDSEAIRETRMEAAEGGRNKYRAAPCRTCGNDLRYTMTGRCIVCEKRHSVAYNAAFKARLRAKMAE